MTSLAALALGSSLMATALSSQAPDETSTFETEAQARQEHEESKRAQQTRLRASMAVGTMLEVGSLIFHLLDTSLVARDLKMSSAGCDGPDDPCWGAPFMVLIPAGATTMGWIGAARLAAGRGADLTDSTMFWVGTGVEAAAYALWFFTWSERSRNGRLAVDSTFVSMVFLGTVMQVWGALSGPTRKQAASARALHWAPGCAPVAGGVTCGIAVAGL
jgi:hypothetical protein